MTTFNSLILSVKEWANRTDEKFIAQIPEFINLAEREISRDCKNIGLTKYVISSADNGGGFVAGNPVIAKPTGWRRTLSFTNGANGVINKMQVRVIDFVESYWPDDSLTGVPIYYADYNSELFWKVAPTPAENYPYKVSYMGFPLPLSEENQTNWYTQYIPDILLFGSLKNAMPYLKNDDRLPAWQAQYDQKIKSINMQDTERFVDRQAIREAD